MQSFLAVLPRVQDADIWGSGVLELWVQGFRVFGLGMFRAYEGLQGLEFRVRGFGALVRWDPGGAPLLSHAGSVRKSRSYVKCRAFQPLRGLRPTFYVFYCSCHLGFRV